MKIPQALVCIGLGVLLTTPSSVRATPYASGVTVSGTTVNWHLNESVSNGVVAVLFNVSGTSYGSSNYLGGTAAQPVLAGPQTFSLGANTNFQIYVFSVGAGTPYQISPNPGTTAPASPLVDFYGPRGVGVNRNPNSPHFGTIYVANASPAADTVRATQKGVYALNADFTDAFGYGNTAMPPVGTGAGQIQYGSSSTYGVWRVFVGPDDMVYIGDASGASTAGTTVGGGVWMAQPNLSSATDLFPFNGGVGASQLVCSAGTPNVTGSYAAGTLTLYNMEWNRSGSDALGNASSGYQTVWEYDFFTNSPGPNTPLPLPWNLNNLPLDLPSAGTCGSTYGYPTGGYGSGNPNLTVSSGIGSVDEVVGDFYLAPDGKFFCSEERSANTGTTTLWIYDTKANGNCLLWDSLDANNQVDPFATTYGLSVSPDDKYMALGCSSASGNSINDGQILVVALDTQPNAIGTTSTGLPDVNTITRIQYGTGNNSLRGTAFDLANNVYCVSGSDDSMRCFSLGITATCITGNDTTGTNGTFSESVPSQTVTVVADEPLISQANSYGNPTSGTFTFSRAGSTASSLTVFYTIGGTATNGSTYASIPSSITIPAGSSSAQVTITPSASITSAATLSVILSIAGNFAYSVSPPGNATMEIANTGPQKLGVTGVVGTASMYRGISNDYASFIVTRFGDTNVAAYDVPINAFTLTGTAVPGVDYAGILSDITVNQGDQTEEVTVTNPVCTGVYAGNKTIIATLNGNSPVPIVAGSATLTLVDNMDPPAPVLWSDTLQSAADSVNWTLTFADTNLSQSTSTVLPTVIDNYPNYTASNPDPNPLDDFDVEFGYSVTNDGVGLSPLMALNGWTSGLKMTVNKIAGFADGGLTGSSGGVNLYPAGKTFSGNFAFRFSMCLTEGVTYTTEFNDFGINHYGTNCNWFAGDYLYGNGTTNADGFFFWIDADLDGWSGVNTYTLVGGPPLPNTGWKSITSASAFVAPADTYFKNPVPYDSVPAGGPSGGVGASFNTWADVEVKQVNNLVTMSINKFPIMTYYNNTNFAKSGDIMLGYDDPFASVGNIASALAPGAGVYYVNARVVQLTPPNITSQTLSGSTLTIAFSDSDTDDTPASFEVLSSTKVNGTYTKIPATFAPTPTGTWTAAVTATGSPSFYKVVRLN